MKTETDRGTCASKALTITYLTHPVTCGFRSLQAQLTDLWSIPQSHHLGLTHIHAVSLRAKLGGVPALAS